MIHLRMSGQVLIAAGGRGAARRTPTSRWRSTTDVSCGSSIRARSARWSCSTRTTSRSSCPSWPCWASTRSPSRSPARDLRRITRSTHRGLKPLLLDQHAIAGIGNIYADEILHGARLRPDRPASSLDARSTGTPPRFDRERAHRGDRRWRVDARRRAVRRSDGVGRVVPGRPPRLRARRRTLPHLRAGLDPAHDHGRSWHALLSGLPALTAGRRPAGLAAFRGIGRSRE